MLIKILTVIAHIHVTLFDAEVWRARFNMWQSCSLFPGVHPRLQGIRVLVQNYRDEVRLATYWYDTKYGGRWIDEQLQHVMCPPPKFWKHLPQPTQRKSPWPT